MQDLIVQRPEGLYCPPGDFYIDPWRPVDRAVITHAHADHARMGHGHYLAATPAEGVLRSRLGQNITLQNLDYGEQIVHNGVALSLHPAGHVLGSAQVRLAHAGQTWVASGDYKVAPDATCTPFEPVRCDVFITESTFGLPIYRWRPDVELFTEINNWWAANTALGRASVLMCYSFGKAQRILSGVDASIAPIIVHGSVQTLNTAYRAAGVALPVTLTVDEVSDPADFKRALVLCPPGAAGVRRAGPPQASTAPSGGSEAHEVASVGVHSSPFAKRFGDFSDAFASGWMQLRGARRRGGYDKGFVLSDHADWPGLMGAIAATSAQRVIVTHGSVPVLVRYLTEQGLQAEAFHTEYGDDPVEEQVQPAVPDPAMEAPAP
ncbi:MAG: ligase-associated DNA damage response exonuclease [Polaromonas sp.]|uniref:ligase-associated DNA damage response exonuclease n=1 Tax=Polaromonas sp. TaxID=1869339 RepID=UPI002732A331|nr:ligase-associated DNA damage response exonuclease [Polaromonas sp.]MDP2819769.1 ligase-associated DNA damage response exonuclease [Polaromonas sp.]